MRVASLPPPSAENIVKRRKKMRWEFLREEEFPSAIEKAGGLCVIPIGCLEMHGEHLPVGTDSLKAHALAVLAAEKTGAVVFPTAMWFGDVMGAHKIERPWEKHRAGYITLSPELLMQILKEDDKVNNSIWNMDFQPENFCQYVFTNIMALLQSGEANCRFFIYLLENLLYE
jgi:hypothetical protein